MGAYIKRHRLRHNLSLSDVAYATGIKIHRLQSVERGDDTLGIHHWPALCRAIPGLNTAVLDALSRRQNRRAKRGAWARFWYRHGSGWLVRLAGVYVSGILAGTVLVHRTSQTVMYLVAIAHLCFILWWILSWED